MAFKDIPGCKRLPLDFPIYVVQEESVSFGGRSLRKNGLIIWYKGEMVYCDHFPRNYEGNNPRLIACWYNFDMGGWEDPEPMKNLYTKLLWAVWRSGGYKKCRSALTEQDYREMMKHDRRHKRGSGQRENVTAITDYGCGFKPSGKGVQTGRWGTEVGYWCVMKA